MLIGLGLFNMGWSVRAFFARPAGRGRQIRLVVQDLMAIEELRR
jgi:hypothetical protein